MIPAGILSQRKERELYFVNFNNDDEEGLFPTLPTWENEVNFVFNVSGANRQIIGGPSEVFIKDGITLSYESSLNAESDTAINFVDDRANRFIRLLENGRDLTLLLTAPALTKIKVHAWCRVPSGYLPSLPVWGGVRIQQLGSFAQAFLDDPYPRDNLFSYSPYDGVSGSYWISTSEWTVPSSGVSSIVFANEASDGRMVVCNAIAIEIL